jgi:hypothetical protein
VVYLVNLSEADYAKKKNKFLAKIVSVTTPAKLIVYCPTAPDMVDKIAAKMIATAYAELSLIVVKCLFYS